MPTYQISKPVQGDGRTIYINVTFVSEEEVTTAEIARVLEGVKSRKEMVEGLAEIGLKPK